MQKIMVVSTAIFAAMTLPCQAQLLTGVSFDQQLILVDRKDTNADSGSGHLAGNALPVSGALTASTPNGGYINGSYRFIGDDQTADFNVVTQEAFHGDYALQTGCLLSAPNLTQSWTYFTTSQATQYTLNMGWTGNVSGGTHGETFPECSYGFELYQIFGNNQWYLEEETRSDSGSTYPRTGFLEPGQYAFFEQTAAWVWTATNCAAGDYTGDSAFDFSLTASVPEPGSLGLLALGIMTLLGTKSPRQVRR